MSHVKILRGYTQHGSLQCVRAYVRESKVFVTMVLILIFGEVLGLYGCVLPAAAQHLSQMSLKVGL